MTAPFQLPTQIITDYACDGAVVLRGVLTPAEVRELAEGIEHNLAQPVPPPRMMEARNRKNQSCAVFI